MTTKTDLFHTIHKFIGDLFEPLATEAQRDAWKFNDDELDTYREKGFVKGKRILNDTQITMLRDQLELMRTGENARLNELHEIDAAYREAPDKNVFHFLGAWRIDESFHDLIFHPGVTVPAAQLLDTPRVRFWHDQVFYKPPHHPGVVSWHQDYSYWTRTGPPRHLSCWIGLDDSTEESGCIWFVPGSHRWDLLPKESLLEDMDAVQKHLTPEQAEQFKPEPLELQPGECSFHDCKVLHSSYGNKSDHPRRGIVINMMHPETRCTDGSQPLLLHTPIVPEGAIVEGVDFPITYGAECPLT